MKQYDNTNTGLLARNDRKEAEQHPDFTGSLNVGGVEYWLSAWVKEGKNGKLAGKKFFSLSIRPKDGMPDRKPVPKDVELTEENWHKHDFKDDAIPF